MILESILKMKLQLYFPPPWAEKGTRKGQMNFEEK